MVKLASSFMVAAFYFFIAAVTIAAIVFALDYFGSMFLVLSIIVFLLIWSIVYSTTPDEEC